MAPIPDPLMGDVWPAAQPGPDGADYGIVEFAPKGAFAVRSFQSFTLVYTVGAYGLDDTGAIKIVQRWTGDGGQVQFSDPAAPNFVTAVASNGVALELHAEPYPHQRPWYNGLRVTVRRGFMRPGDTIRIVYGDRSGGSPGYRLQTFCEAAFEFKVLADPCATGVFLPVASAAIEIVAGPTEQWSVIAPTLRRAGDPFALTIRAEDFWGNATGEYAGTLRLEATRPVLDLPDSVEFPTGQRALRLEGLRIADPGVTRIRLRDATGRELALSNPILTREDGPRSYWGDLHGQSGETVGIDPMRMYLEFGRDVAGLDVMSHQANDFQITGPFWAEINALSAEFTQDGTFVVFPGYEWSGNTPVGGDHNVFFAHEGEQIHRSSHALLVERGDIASDAATIADLFSTLQGRDAVVFAHVGGRPADISLAHDARLRTAVEVHSDWGTFEWILTDAFDLGYRVGVVCNSDGHKGAPGASHPGASEFGAYGGLTCFLSDALTRDGIFGAMRGRKHYGTTGCRLHLEVTADLGETGVVYAQDPAHSSTPGTPCPTAHMGQIAATDAAHVAVSISCHAHAPLVSIDVLSGDRTVGTLRPYGPSDLGRRIRVLWQGAEYRGRGRQTEWSGTLRMVGPRIERMEPINAWNHERQIVLDDPFCIRFDAVTTGNFGGFDLWHSEGSDGRLDLETNLLRAERDLLRIGYDEQAIAAGGLDRKLRLLRLPERLETLDFAATLDVPVVQGADTPVWVRVTTEDGCTAWSSPIYLVGQKEDRRP